MNDKFFESKSNSQVSLFVIIFIICIFSKQALYLLVRFLRKFLCDKYFCPGFFRIIRSVS